MINIDIVFNSKKTNAWHLELYGYLKYSRLNYLFEFLVVTRIIVVYVLYFEHCEQENLM